MTPPILTLPLTPATPRGSLLATKHLLRIALSSASSSASTQCTNGQPKSSTVSPSHDLVQPKPQLSPASAKPECPIPSPQSSNTCPQLVQLSPSRQTWTSPQRASPPSPVLPLVSTSSTSSPVPPQSPLTSITHTTDTTKELKSAKPKTKPGNSPEEIPHDLKVSSSQTKSVEGTQTAQSPSTEPQPEGTLEKTTVSYTDFFYLLVRLQTRAGKVCTLLDFSFQKSWRMQTFALNNTPGVCICMMLHTEVCVTYQVCKRPVVSTEEPRSQKTLSVSIASTAGREHICEEASTHADNHSGAQDVS